MGELRLPGLLTGIDTAALIEQLMIVNSRRLALYQVEKIEYEEKTTAINELRTKVSSLNSAVSALSDAEKLETFNVSSSDSDILTASASSDANPGSHSIEINQLATSETWIQDTSTFDYKTDYVGGGNFIYSYNHQESVITAVENETTLEDFVNLINDDPDNPGVTASLLLQGGKYHLMLSGQETVEDYQISINASNTEVWEPDEGQSDHTFTKNEENAVLSTKITELDQFSGTLGTSDKITISGKNHFNTDISPDFELTITDNTTLGHLIDSINEHFDGVATAVLVGGQIRLTDHIYGTSGLEVSLSFTGDATLGLPTMAVSTEGGSTSESLASLSSSSFIETQNAQSSKVKIDGYPSTTAAEKQTLTLNAVATGGHFHLTYNGETTGEILYTASTTDIKDALETLSTVESGDITVDGTGLNQAGDTTFTFLASEGDVGMISIDATALSGPTTCSIVETVKGNDGWISRNSNSISDAMEGITLNLHDVTAVSEPIEITLSRNTGAVSSKVSHMVNTYNSLISFLAEKTEYNVETKTMGILSDDIAVTFIKTQANNPIVGIVPGFTDLIDTFIQASDIGITLDGAGKIKFDTSKFNEAIKEDYMGVLELLGAAGTGNSDSNVIKFYAASKKYTSAGTYDIEVDIETNAITDVRIKLSSESTWRDDATWSNNLVTGNSTFGNYGDPLYPENGLQLTVDPNQPNGTYTATVNVKQGFAGALEDLLEEILKANGRLDISEDIVEDRITGIESTIKREEERLELIETRLIEKFARLEKTLATLQQQMSAVSIVSQIAFGGQW